MLYSFFSDKIIVFTMLGLCFLLVASWLISWRLKRVDVFVSTSVLLMGIAGAICLYAEFSIMQARCVFSCLIVFVGIAYPFLNLFVHIRKKLALRRLERAENARKLQFTLPEKDNEYIRLRLNTVLNTNTVKEGTAVETKAFRTAYVKKLIGGLKEKSLTLADRLKVEEYESVIGVYTKKEAWYSDDVETISSVLSSVLKLSAKYSV